MGSSEFDRQIRNSNLKAVTHLEELLPQEYQNQSVIVPDEISEDDYFSAEIKIAIGYN